MDRTTQDGAPSPEEAARERDASLLINDMVGLAVMEVQVMHFGHMELLSWMRATCSKRIVALGSCELSGQPGHPFTFRQRKAMVEAVFGAGTFTFVPLNDIEATVAEDWSNYLDSKLTQLRLPRPTDYFCGSRLDARWYEHAYARTDGPGTREGPGLHWLDYNNRRRLRILDRDAGDVPSARQIRDLVEMRDPEWRRYVPPVLWRYVEWHYPPGLRVALRGDVEPDANDHPVGTLFKGKDADAPVLTLYDDGRWRPKRTRTDEKGDYARSRAAARKE